MNLAIAFRRRVTHGNNKHEQVRTFLGQFGQDLHEVKCPLTALQTGVAWFVVEAVEPSLKLVEDQCRWLFGE